jgi:hypothetical protein
MGKRKTNISVDDFAQVHTFQMRLHGDFPHLDDFAQRYNDAKYLTYAEAKKQGVAFTSLKSSNLLEKFNLPARLHNAIAIDLAGMVSSIQEKSKLDVVAVVDKLLTVEKVYAKIDKKVKEWQAESHKQNFPKAKFTELHRQRQRKKRGSRPAGCQATAVGCRRRGQISVHLFRQPQAVQCPASSSVERLCRSSGVAGRLARSPRRSVHGGGKCRRGIWQQNLSGVD